ncbi:MAG: FAD-dependent oxidoreductase [Pseudomonadota bacterium]|nr:FAD-dependent oxidoreductase [Pseudomonadota bacterium]
MKRLLLVGAGHAHAQVLKDWIGKPVPGCDLTIVSPLALTPYSGMVPGWLAGTYRFDEIDIDFAALAAAAGARFLVDEMIGLDPKRRQVRLRSGRGLDYDVLSLNVGSTLTPPVVPPGARARILSLRPLDKLRHAWDALLGDPLSTTLDAPLVVTAVGGGAAGVESLLATLKRLRSMRSGRPVQGALVTASATLLPGFAPAAIGSAHFALDAAGVVVQTGRDYDDGVARSSDIVLWATGAEAHPWQRGCGLAVSDRGFIRVDERLRSCSHPQVHAVGDCAEWQKPLPKAGVFAVRMGPALSRNLRAALGAATPVSYVPQRRSLALLSTADGRAIASWGRWSLQGRWLWRWKDRIDRAFVRRFVIAGPSFATDHPTPVSGEPE